MRSSLTRYPGCFRVICLQLPRWLRGACCGAMALGAWTGPIRAQPSSGAEPVVRFTVFAADPIEGLGYVAQPGGAVVPLRFYPTERSPRYEHRGRQPLRLVQMGKGDPVAEVPIPTGMRDVLLLVSSTTDSTGLRRYRVTVLDDGPQSRVAGQIQLLNLSGLELTGELNGRRLAVAAGLNPAQMAGRSARLALRTAFRGRSYLAWHDTITLGPTGRALLILFPPFLAGSIEVQTRVLLDEPPAAEPARRRGLP